MNNGRFIYVFDTDARDKLLKAGFTLLSKDEANNIFVFLKDGSNAVFALNNVQHVLSNTLSF